MNVNGFGLRVMTVTVVLSWAAVTQAFQVTTETRILLPEQDAEGVCRAMNEAALALAEHIEESVGIRPQISYAGEGVVPRGSICIGEELAARVKLVPDDLVDFHNVIAEKNGSLYLFGHDRIVRKGVKGQAWHDLILPSVKAVCSFEERYMGVAYVSPGRVGCEVPPRKSIEVPDNAFVRDCPKKTCDHGRLYSMMYCMANDIFGNGTCCTFGGHLYAAAVPYATYSKTHPEYFALIGGTRRQPQANNPALCISNPEVRRLLVEKIVEKLDEGYDAVELGQNDGGAFCECENCAKFGNVDPSLEKYWAEGEKFWILHLQVAEEVYRLRPDKTVQIISYSKTTEPPRSIGKLPPNVMIEMMKTTPEAFAKWGRLRPSRGMSVYTYLWGEYFMPGLTPSLSVPAAAAAARRFVDNDVRSVYRCGFGELFGLEGPSYHVFNRLMIDPAQDEKKILDDYCHAAYGPAARAMLEFHDSLDRRLRGLNKIEEGFPRRDGGLFQTPSWLNTPDEVLAYVYAPAALKSLEGFLSRAETTEGLTAKQRKRLELVRLEFDYAAQLGRIIWLYGAFRLSPTKASFDPLADAVLERNRLLDALYDEKGRMRTLDGWPEVRPFGGFGRAMMQHNGRMLAVLNAPFTWDVKAMREAGVIPGGPVKEMDAVRVTGPFAADAFDAEAFAAIPVQVLNGMQLGKVDYATRFKIGYDDENLYLAVKAELPASMTFTPKGRDGFCFRQECMDFLVDPTFAHAKCFHYIWNAIPDSCLEEAQGLITDTLDPKYGQMDISWNGKWTYEVKRSGDIWYSLVTIPHVEIGAKAPQPGETWYVNFGRETLKPGEEQVSSWNPSMEGRGLRDLESMGKLCFK